MDYIDRVELALDYIEEYLTEDISLEDIAYHAHSSLFWFHRVFALILGESLGEYVRKRRLNRAAEDLVTSEFRIIDIAVKYGFSSHEAFTRSFTRHFGVTPKQYRRSGLIALRKRPVKADFLRSERKINGGLMSTETVIGNGVRIIELPSCKMVTSKKHDLGEFDEWWSAVDQKRSDRFYPRDFMYYDAVDRELVWLYALSDFDGYSEKYDVIDFSGGLYAAAISRDGDDLDGERVVSQVKEWIMQTKYFEVDESAERPLLFHVTTTDLAYEKMKYRQLDLYVPVK